MIDIELNENYCPWWDHESWHEDLNMNVAFSLITLELKIGRTPRNCWKPHTGRRDVCNKAWYAPYLWDHHIMVQKLSHPPRWWDNNFEPGSQFMSEFWRYIQWILVCGVVLQNVSLRQVEVWKILRKLESHPPYDLTQSWFANTRSLSRKLWKLTLSPHFMDWIRAPNFVTTGWQLLMWELFAGSEFGRAEGRHLSWLQTIQLVPL